AGAHVAVHYYQNEIAAKQTLAMIRDRGSEGFIVQADTTKPDEISRMVKKVHADFGALDIFVSNARPEVTAFFQPPMDITLEQWDAAFDLQAKGIHRRLKKCRQVRTDWKSTRLNSSHVSISYAVF